jgi:hypothetical protein
VKLGFISEFRNSNCILISSFGIIAQMWLALPLSFEKWYQSNLVTLSGAGALYVVDFEEGVRDLSGKDCDTPES